MDTYDVVVIGSGFGGLSAALELARSGARVALFERLNYPGGCASTFKRRGLRFESGATLFSGFGPGQHFERLIDELELDVTVDLLDPLVTLQAPDLRLEVPPDRTRLLEQFCGLPGAPADTLREFFAYQERVADTLWALFDDPSLIPPFGPSELLRHARRSPRYLTLVPLLGTPLSSVVRKFGLYDFEPLLTYLNAVCQITVQASVDEAEAPFALAAMDYYFRGTGHVDGGIGKLAWALAEAFEGLGGHLYMTDEVKGLERWEDGWKVSTRRREVTSNHVVANLLPAAVQRITGASNATLRRLGNAVDDGWGAAMLYINTADTEDLPEQAHHIELVADTSAPFVEGNHVFLSLNSRSEGVSGTRNITASTHVRLSTLKSGSDQEQAEYVEQVQTRMKQTIAGHLPGILEHADVVMPGSPRTFERFTARPNGAVGGIPRRVGLHNYRDFLPSPVLHNLYMVGDTMFPGQSTLATAIGGMKTAQVIRRRLGVHRRATAQ